MLTNPHWSRKIIAGQYNYYHQIKKQWYGIDKAGPNTHHSNPNQL
jgi:hypothetical protein